jgi:hypothetical protein
MHYPSMHSPMLITHEVGFALIFVDSVSSL